MLVPSKIVQKCAAKTRKIHLHPFEFKEDFYEAGISPYRNGVVVLVPVDLPTIFEGVHVGTWILLDKKRRPKPRFSSDFGLLWTILDVFLVRRGDQIARPIALESKLNHVEGVCKYRSEYRQLFFMDSLLDLLKKFL
ncbi:MULTISPECIES: hypothetical protein [unclassified Desulfovibrio]|uniref:hypothetical protein n=1 Tax=unclassified Desulfovibrio TaxID=2593640 RepID=UPI0013ED1EA3|nr:MULTISPECIES: hypothetical protein [unclassified Desulfovibrio]